MHRIGLIIGTCVVAAVVTLCLAWVFLDATLAEGPNAPQKEISAMREVAIDGNVVHVELARTPEERRQGLSGRAGLAIDEGLLFVFETEGKWGFWMKDMLFPIDIVWIGSDGKVAFIKEDVAPESYPESFVPDRPALYVLELPAGYCASHNVRIGSVVGL